MREKTKIILPVILGGVAILWLLVSGLLKHNDEAPPRPAPTNKYQKKLVSQKDIGPLPSCTGQVTQASSMLQLIADQPKKTDYLITYTTGIDTVSFHYSLPDETLTRTHKWPDDYQTEEIWRKHVIHRLTSAANGGSLNNTPSGKIKGSIRSFYTEQKNDTDM